MAHRIAKSRFKARALELLREVETTGEALILTDHGRPAIEVRRYHPDERSALEILRNSVSHYDGPTESVADSEWEAMK